MRIPDDLERCGAGLAVGIAFALWAFVVPGCTTARAGADGDEMVDAAGQNVFVAQKCNRCHKAPGVRGRGSDLSQVGAKRSEPWLRGYLLHEQDIDGQKHSVEWGGSQTELEALVKWLASLK